MKHKTSWCESTKVNAYRWFWKNEWKEEGKENMEMTYKFEERLETFYRTKNVFLVLIQSLFQGFTGIRNQKCSTENNFSNWS